MGQSLEPSSWLAAQRGPEWGHLQQHFLWFSALKAGASQLSENSVEGAHPTQRKLCPTLVLHALASPGTSVAEVQTRACPPEVLA